MSYDLYFWREESKSAHGPDEIIDLLAEEKPVTSFSKFPNDAVVAAFQKEFPDIRFEMHQLIWEGLDSGFEISFSHPDDDHLHLITVTCGYSLLNHPEVLNRIIAVAHQFGCGTYDPQVSTRFPEPDRLEDKS